METQRIARSRLRVTTTLVAASLCLSTVTACNTNRERGTMAGGGIGTALGAFVGHKMGGTRGMIIGGLIGAAAGALIGGEIGRHLDEEDRKQAAQNTVDALSASKANNGQVASSSWNSAKNPGVSGEATAMGVGDDCYVVQEVAVIPGKGDVRQETRYCNQDGQWVTQEV